MMQGHFTYTNCLQVLLLLLVFPVCVTAQKPITDSVHMLQGCEVNGKRQEEFKGDLRMDKLDSITIVVTSTGNLASLLAGRTTLYSKDYGAGNMASLSFRGTSSGQSGIYWNGFDLKAPGAGMIDLSLVPSFVFSTVQFQYGGSASLAGIGNMAGAVHLGTNSLFGSNSEISGGFTAGSFGEARQQLQFSVNRKHWGSSTAIQRLTGKNDFPYAVQGENLKRLNAGIKQLALFQSIEKQYKQHHLQLDVWLQQTERDIPSSTTSADSHSNRTDKSARVTGRWKKSSDKGGWTAGIAFFHDYLRYSEYLGDTILLIDSQIDNNTVLTDATFQQRITTWGTLLMAGFNLAYSTININDFGGYRDQKQAGVFISVKQPLFQKKWKLAISLRKEAVNGYYIPLSPAAGLEGKIAGPFYARFQLSGNFRIPSMNDRYWKPGGNQDLKPESGRNAESAILLKNTCSSNSGYTVSLGGFISDINDWISWIPTPQGYWMAANVQRVSIRGIETAGNVNFSLPPFQLQLHAGYVLLDAINEKKINIFDNSEGKQLIYTPRQRMNSSVRIVYRDFLVDYLHAYTGRAYTVRDNTDYVPGFEVANLLIRYSFKLHTEVLIDIQGEVNNIWDTRYEVVKYFPMPGRSFRLGIQAKFKHDNK